MWARWCATYAERFGLERVALVGYSMGGNLVLKLAGEWGSGAPLWPWPRSARPSIWLAGADALHERLQPRSMSGIFCAA